MTRSQDSSKAEVPSRESNKKEKGGPKKKLEKTPAQIIEMKETQLEGQPGKIELGDMQSIVTRSYGSGVRANTSNLISTFDEDLEEQDMANPESMKQLPGGAPERPPKIMPATTGPTASHEDEDGGDLALLSGFTTIEHDDPEFVDATETMRKPVASQISNIVFGSMDNDIFGEGHQRRLRHAPSVQLPPRRRRESESSQEMGLIRDTSEMDMLRDQERLMQREIDKLAKQVQHLADQKDIIEEKNELLTRQMQDMKRTMPSLLEDVDKDTGSLAEAFTGLQHENRILKEQLQDAQAHIFSLQPYRKELTPEEVGREFDDLVERITDWVNKWMSPYTEDLENTTEEVLSMARKRHTEWNRFKKTIHHHPDLLAGSRFPETDEDICMSIILRFLNDHIFQKICYGMISGYIDVLNFVEQQMQVAVEPKRDLFSVRSWVSEAYNAIFSAKEFSHVRSKARQRLTGQLSEIFRVFCKKERFEWFVHGFETECVIPAMALYEKLQCSVHHYYLDITPFIVWSPGSNTQYEASPEFIDNIRDLDCRDLLKHRKAFNLNKMNPQPTKTELYENMTNVCTLTPALYVRQIGRRDAIKEPVVVRRQQMLVAWGNDEKKAKFVKNGERTLIHTVFHTKPERTGISGVESWVGGLTSRWG